TARSCSRRGRTPATFRDACCTTRGMTERDALGALRGEDPVAAARAAAVLWNMWHRSGDAHLDAILPGGIAAMEQQDLAAAEAAARFRRTLEVYPTLSTARANLQTATAAVVRWN